MATLRAFGGLCPPRAASFLVLPKVLSLRWYSPPPKWGGAPHSGGQNYASTLSLGKAGGGD